MYVCYNLLHYYCYKRHHRKRRRRAQRTQTKAETESICKILNYKNPELVNHININILKQISKRVHVLKELKAGEKDNYWVWVKEKEKKKGPSQLCKIKR